MTDQFSATAVARRLKLVRIATWGIKNQKGFAELLGAASTTYNNWEIGRTRLPLDYAYKIKAMLGYDANYLFSGDLSGLPLPKIEALKGAELILEAHDEKVGKATSKSASGDQDRPI